jgi:hypothetical protein
MLAKHKLSLGGKIALGHFALVALVLLIPAIPQPEASVSSGSHWFWWLLTLHAYGLPLLTFPVSLFFGHALHGGPFYLWTTPQWFVPLCFILAANSFAVGYGYAYAHSFITKRRARATAS